MQILLALIIGAALGYGMHLLVAGRETRGSALGPVVGAVVGGIVWLVLTWLGFGLDNPWLWVAAIAAPPLVVAPLLIVLRRTRLAHDEQTRRRLRIS